MIPTTFMIASEGFNPLEVGAGSFLWTLVIFGVPLPFMWKLVFSRIAAMATERDALASEAILVIRICTLWFAVLLGLVALFLLQRYQRPHARIPESGFTRSTGAKLLESEMVGDPGN